MQTLNSQLGVLVCTVTLEVLADSNGLLDEVVHVLGDGGGETWKVSGVRRSFSRFCIPTARILSCIHANALVSQHPTPLLPLMLSLYTTAILPATPIQHSPLTVGLQDSENLVSSHKLDLGDTVRVTEDDTDLGRGETTLGQLEDLVADLLGGGLGPRWLGTSVGEGRGGNALAGGVHAGVWVSACFE
jgi:hypothetical protein